MGRGPFDGVMTGRSRDQTGPRSREELAAHYEELLAEQESSGLSVAEFAEEVGVSSGTLYSWRRRLADPPSVGELVEVTVADSDAGGGGTLVLRVDERYAIELEEDFDGAALSRLLEVLAEC